MLVKGRRPGHDQILVQHVPFSSSQRDGILATVPPSSLKASNLPGSPESLPAKLISPFLPLQTLPKMVGLRERGKSADPKHPQFLHQDDLSTQYKRDSQERER